MLSNNGLLENQVEIVLPYMHLPFVNWAMRTLTQTLYAQLIWDATTDSKQFIANYFTKFYGCYSDEMQVAYNHIESALTYIAQWRNWHGSILEQLECWGGETLKCPWIQARILALLKPLSASMSVRLKNF